MKNTAMRDLTEGHPFHLMIQFSIPIFMGFILQYLYSFIDTLVVGKYLGVAALAGVGATGPIGHLIVGFCSGVCSGFSIPIALKFGNRDYDGIRRIIGTIFWLCLVMSVSFAVVFSLLCAPILRWLKTPAEAFPYAYHYQIILFLGIPATILYNILSGLIRSLGDSKTPLIFLLIASVLNVGLDLTFVVVFKIGVVGAALATILAQLLSGVFCLLYIRSHFPLLSLSRKNLSFDRRDARQLLSRGIPMGLQVSYIAIGNTIVQAVVNSLGSSAMAAVIACNRINALMACPYDSIGTATSPYVGQNVGARKFDRIHKGALCTTIIGVSYWLIAMLIAFFFSDDLIMLFINPDEPALPEILSYGRMYMQVTVIGFLPLLGVNIFRFSLQGMGCSKLAMISGVMEMLGRVLISVLLVPHFGFAALCFASTAAWTLADCFVIPMYFKVLRKLQNQPQALS